MLKMTESYSVKHKQHFVNYEFVAKKNQYFSDNCTGFFNYMEIEPPTLLYSAHGLPMVGQWGAIAQANISDLACIAVVEMTF